MRGGVTSRCILTAVCFLAAVVVAVGADNAGDQASALANSGPCTKYAKRYSATQHGTWSNRHCYMFYQGPLTFGAANDACVSMGGYLASITSDGEKNFVAQTFNSQIKNTGMWIGLTDVLKEAHWRWLSGEIPVEGNGVVYNNWGSGFPSARSNGRACAQIMNKGMGWADAKCETSLSYMCEVDFVGGDSDVELSLPKWDEQIQGLVTYLEKKIKDFSSDMKDRLDTAQSTIASVKDSASKLSLKFLKIKAGLGGSDKVAQGLEVGNTSNEKQFANFVVETKPKLEEFETQVAEMKSLLDRVEDESQRLETAQQVLSKKQSALEAAQKKSELEQEKFKAVEQSYKTSAAKSFEESMNRQLEHRNRLQRMSRQLNQYVMTMRRTQVELRNKFLQHVAGARSDIESIRGKFADDVESLQQMMKESSLEATQLKDSLLAKRSEAQKMVCKCEPSESTKHPCSCTLCSEFKYGIQDLYPQTDLGQDQEAQDLVKTRRAEQLLQDCAEALGKAHKCGDAPECERLKESAFLCIGFDPPKAKSELPKTEEELVQCKPILTASKLCQPKDSAACKGLHNALMECIGEPVSTPLTKDELEPPPPAVNTTSVAEADVSKPQEGPPVTPPPVEGEVPEATPGVEGAGAQSPEGTVSAPAGEEGGALTPEQQAAVAEAGGGPQSQVPGEVQAPVDAAVAQPAAAVAQPAAPAAAAVAQPAAPAAAATPAASAPAATATAPTGAELLERERHIFSYHFTGHSFVWIKRGTSPAYKYLERGVTMEAWVNPAPAGTGWRTILSTEDKGQGYLLSLSPDNKLAFFSGGKSWDFGTMPVHADEWSHVAVTFDTHTVNLYVNGRAAGARFHPSAAYDSKGDMFIGRQGVQCNCHYFVGTITMVKIFDHVRTESEIEGDMNSAVVAVEAKDGLAGFYPLSDNREWVSDASRYRQNGQVMGNGGRWRQRSTMDNIILPA